MEQLKFDFFSGFDVTLFQLPVSYGKQKRIIMEMFGIAMIWLGLFAAAFLAWFYFIQARNKERMALIEKGADVASFLTKKETRKRFSFPWLKFGLLLTGLGLGLGIGLLIISNPTMSRDLEDVAPGIVFATTFIFGGFGMMLSHFVDKPKTAEQA